MPITMILLSFIAPSCGALIGKTVKNPWLFTIALIINGVILALLHGVILDVIFEYSSNISVQYGLSFGLGIFFPLMVISGLLARRSTIKTQTRSKVRNNEARKTKEKQVSKSSFVADTKKQSEMHMKSNAEIMKVKGDEKYWEVADQEINSEPKHDLWIKCLYACEQNASKAKILYVHERVEQLKLEKNHSVQLKKMERKEMSRALYLQVFIFLLSFSSLIGSVSLFGFMVIDKSVDISPFHHQRDIDELENIIKERNWEAAEQHSRENKYVRGELESVKDSQGRLKRPSDEKRINYCLEQIRIAKIRRTEAYAWFSSSIFGILLFGWLTKRSIFKIINLE